MWRPKRTITAPAILPMVPILSTIRALTAEAPAPSATKTSEKPMTKTSAEATARDPVAASPSPFVSATDAPATNDR